MKEELFSYIQATLQVLAPDLNEKEKEQLVREVVTQNFPKCALAYLKEKTVAPKKNFYELDINPAIKEYETSKCMPYTPGLNPNYSPKYPPTYGDITWKVPGDPPGGSLFSNGSEESNYIAV